VRAYVMVPCKEPDSEHITDPDNAKQKKRRLCRSLKKMYH
jgi:hypothetical protein